MDKRTEAQGDRNAWLVLILYSIAMCIVISTSRQMEIAKSGVGESGAAIWIFEVTSHLAILVAAIVLPTLLTRFPFQTENWLRHLTTYGLGFGLFAIIHIMLMVALRHVFYPMVEGGPYHFGLLTTEPWIYELRKDFMSFVMTLLLFAVSRQLSQMKFEKEVAKKDVRETGKLSLSSGGRTIFLDAVNIRCVKAAGNYVEVFTETDMHLVRMTLSAIELLLGEAKKHVRVHRSYVVNRQSILSISPNGRGESVLTLTDGLELPVSRKYRSEVEKIRMK